MTNPEPNSRLNVPIKLVANPTGDFAIAGAADAHGVIAEGAVAAVSQLQNLAAPTGELSPTSAAAVLATGELSFSSNELAQAGGELSISTPNIAPTADAGLRLAPPSFTY